MYVSGIADFDIGLVRNALNIFISAAEESADMHAAALMREAHKAGTRCSFVGVTGPRMRLLGAETVGDLASHAAMLAESATLVGRALRVRRDVEKCWRARRPDVVVLLDSPEFHLPLAVCARRLGLPVLYYIAPQTWASRAGRNKRISAMVDRLACILPFEEAYFRAAGVRATFVGHPLIESLALEKPDSRASDRLRAGGRPLVALLPGSRRHVIDEVLPLQARVLAAVRRSLPVHAAVSCLSPDRREQIAAHLAAEHQHAEIVVADNASLLTAADLVLVASGTATLHVAHYRKPMIVMYHARGLAWTAPAYDAFGRLVVSTHHLSLVNILAGARLVPEFMPFIRDLDAVSATAVQLLRDATWREFIVRRLDDIMRPLEQSRASTNVWRIIQEMTAPRTGAAS